MKNGEVSLKTVCDFTKCAGCMLCVEVCPTNAITVQDHLSSYDAVIDDEKCINCNRCHQLCPQNNEPELTPPIRWTQGWADEETRKSSSSGGYAAAIMRAFREQGGEVCSCTQEEGEFVFRFVQRVEDLFRFTGSKYIKSNPIGIYKQIRAKLREGKSVLFIGLPCQVTALKRYVGKNDEEKLYTVDLICHGTPSPRLLDMFLRENKAKMDQKVSFRNKTAFQIWVGDKPVLPRTVLDRYSMAFLHGLCYTENCYACQYARVERVSDVTLGDSWGTDLPIEEQKKGISLALIQTEKGQKLLNDAGVATLEVDHEKARKANHQLYEPSHKPNGARDKLFDMIQKGKSFSLAVYSVYTTACIRQNIKALYLNLMGKWK